MQDLNLRRCDIGDKKGKTASYNASYVVVLSGTRNDIIIIHVYSYTDADVLLFRVQYCSIFGAG